MTAYTYTAYDKTGRRVTGVLVADGTAEARSQLAAQGLYTESLSTRQPAGQGAWLARLRQKSLDAEGLALFTRQVSVLLASRVPVDKALDVMIGSRTASRVNRVAADLQAQVRDGLSLSGAMARHPGSFPDFYRAAVEAGESSGYLPDVCEVLADYLEDRLTRRDKTVTSLVYPLFVGAVSLVVAGVLLVNVVPEMVALFEQTGQALPPITRVTIALSGALAAHWPWLAAGAAGLGFGAAAVFRRPGPKRALHRVVLRLPVFGPLARARASLLFLRTLSLVLTARVPVVPALRHAHNAVDNLSIRAESAQVATLVERGQSVTDAIGTIPSLPVIARQMIENGERSGQLARMTERAARMQEFDLSTRAQRVAALLEPLLLMVVGGLVLVILLSVLLPILTMQTGIS